MQLYGWITDYQTLYPIKPVKNILHVLNFWLLKLKLLWTFVWRLCEICVFIYLENLLKILITYLKISVNLMFLCNCHIILQNCCTIYTLNHNAWIPPGNIFRIISMHYFSNSERLKWCFIIILNSKSNIY